LSSRLILIPDTMGKELFVGTFVHSLSLEELEVGEKSVIGVEEGKIVFIEKNVKDLDTVKTKQNFEAAKVSEPSALLTIDDRVNRKSILSSWVH
jgi:hypothetical protein